MLQIVKKLFCIIIIVYSAAIFAKDNSEVKNTCEVSGGTFTETSNGNWACCWDNWGCYGCVKGICKLKCHNERCRKANDTVRPSPGVKTIKGLAPAESKDPIAPMQNKSKKSKSTMPMNQKN